MPVRVVGTTIVKHLPKHLRPRWRYLAVALETWPDADLDRDQFQRAVWQSARTLLGDAGTAPLDLSVFQFDVANGQGTALVRTRRGTVEAARASLACLSTIGEDPVGIRVAGVSGTVRACEEKYMGRHRVHQEQRDVAFADAERTAFLREGRADVRLDGTFAGATTLDI